MRKFSAVKEKYLLLKVRENNIDFAIDAIKYGTGRQLILNDLIASHRGMELTQANHMLNDLYEAYGGEYKKENRRGYVYGSLFITIAFVVGMMKLQRSDDVPTKIEIIGIASAVLGVFSFILAIRGRFREEKVNRFTKKEES